ncbi:MAG: hypothetical protein ACJA0X_001156 [Cyclobacteriaceae bacterium]|jgi:hypothetical protein
MKNQCAPAVLTVQKNGHRLFQNTTDRITLDYGRFENSGWRFITYDENLDQLIR